VVEHPQRRCHGADPRAGIQRLPGEEPELDVAVRVAAPLRERAVRQGRVQPAVRAAEFGDAGEKALLGEGHSGEASSAWWRSSARWRARRPLASWAIWVRQL